MLPAGPQLSVPELRRAAAAGAGLAGISFDTAGRDWPAPLSTITVADFVERFFIPEHVASKELSGRTHYQAILKHVLSPEVVDRGFRVDAAKSKAKLKSVPDWPYLKNVRLCDTRPEHVQRLVEAAGARGYSTQTVVHIRNVVSAIFAHAQKKRCFTGENPASLVTLPAMTRKQQHTLTLPQAKAVLEFMRYPEKEMTLIAMLTSMNVAEISGLQWKRVNLTDSWSDAGAESIPPATIAVRTEWYRGKFVNLGQKSRLRNLTIPSPLLPVLRGLQARPKYTGPEDFVFVSQAGTPVSPQNLATRRLKPIGERLQMPWLSWQIFRRTHTTLSNELGRQSLEDGVSKAAGPEPPRSMGHLKSPEGFR